MWIYYLKKILISLGYHSDQFKRCFTKLQNSISHLEKNNECATLKDLIQIVFQIMYYRDVRPDVYKYFNTQYNLNEGYFRHRSLAMTKKVEIENVIENNKIYIYRKVLGVINRTPRFKGKPIDGKLTKLKKALLFTEYENLKLEDPIFSNLEDETFYNYFGARQPPETITNLPPEPSHFSPQGISAAQASMENEHQNSEKLIYSPPDPHTPLVTPLNSPEDINAARALVEIGNGPQNPKLIIDLPFDPDNISPNTSLISPLDSPEDINAAQSLVNIRKGPQYPFSDLNPVFFNLPNSFPASSTPPSQRQKHIDLESPSKTKILITRSTRRTRE